jgi:hypothetical protein
MLAGMAAATIVPTLIRSLDFLVSLLVVIDHVNGLAVNLVGPQSPHQSGNQNHSNSDDKVERYSKHSNSPLFSPLCDGVAHWRKANL